MKENIQQIAEQVISGTAGQIIDKAGYASIGTGLGLNATASDVAVKHAAVFMDLTLTEWAAVASIAGTISFLIKNVFEVWWKTRMEKKYGRPND